MPAKAINQNTFNAMHIAQATLNYTRSTLKYGSANQITDLAHVRGGATPSNGQSIPRVSAIRDGVKSILAKPHHKVDDLTDALFREGISAGTAAFYRAGNCGEHATVAFAYLVHFGYPGLTITKCSSKLMDHAFVLVSGTGSTVVCDPWPSEAQAVLWEDHFCYRAHDAYDAIATFTITPDNMGFDPMVEAFKSIDPKTVKTLKPADTISGYAQKVIDDYVAKHMGHGVYDHHRTTTGDAFQDYSCGTELLSTILGANEQWTAKLLPMLTQTIDPLGVSVGLDPKLRAQ